MKFRLMATTILAAALFAQGPPMQSPMANFPWWEGQIAAELNLTDAQKQQVDAVQREYRAKLIDARAELQKAELTLEDTMNADPFDLRKATDAANRASKARDELTREFTQMGLRMRAVLTKDQWEKARARAQRGGRGFGGPGGRGGRGPEGKGGRFGGPNGPPPGN